MIFGIGHDIVENSRISFLLNKYGQRFVTKILSSQEQEIFLKRTDKVNYLAKRFAAKESFAKACNTGLRSPVLLTHISILNDALGKPVFQFSTTLQQWLTTHRITACHVSLSDENNLSSAFVILEINS